MSAPAEPKTSGPESPTTARPLELDDDDVPEPGNALADSAAPPTSTTAATGPASEEAPPPKPPRPVTEQQKNMLILKEAFPGVDPGVIKAVLSASRGQVEPAFNALLEMTDPDAVKNDAEPTPPPQPPRPSGRSQLEADEMYARQLAQHYENVGAYEARTANRAYGGGRQGQQQQQQQRQRRHDDDEEREYNFLDDELPVIRENLRKGFVETQTKVNGWIQQFKKKIDETFDESEGQQGHAGGSFPGRQQGPPRRSGDYDRYDADPQVLTDDFSGITLSPGEQPAQGGANKNVFQPPPRTSSADIYDSSPRVPPKDAAGAKPGAKGSKWQPLSTVEPSPMENDPFSLGDSDDDKDVAKPKAGGESAAPLSDEERLKQAAAEAMSDSLVDGKAEAAKKS